MKAPAWIKLAFLALLGIAVMALPALWLLPVALAVLIFIAVLGASPVRLYRMLLPAMPFIMVISALQALLQGSGAVIAGYWHINVTAGGLTIAFISAARMTLLYLAGSAVTATTGENELAGALEGAFRPLDRLTGRSIGRDISTMMVLALAFIPMVREDYLSIKTAQEARGVRYMGPIDAFKGTYAIAVPLLYSLSRRADDIALAMEARCYGIKK
jgi:energy-coupling factor transporter transmembrane protein EcfT